MAVGLWASDADDLAKRLVAASARATNPAGICVIPQGGPLVQAMVGASRFLVVGQENDATRMQASAKALADAGLLATRAYVVQAPPGESVLAERSANLVIYERADASLDPDRVVAALAPGGEAFVAGDVRAWAAKASNATVRVVAGWTVLTRGPVPGGAPWTHRYHDASATAYAADTAFTWPPLTQWLQKPYNDGGECNLLAGGRLYTAWCGEKGLMPRMRQNPGDWAQYNRIEMRDANNGLVLWNRRIDPKYGADLLTSPAVLTADTLYQIEFAAPVIEVIDPATGTIRTRFTVGKPDEQVKWIALVGGRLYALLGAVEVTMNIAASDKSLLLFDAKIWKPGHPAKFGYGNTLVSLEAGSGAEVWRQTMPGPVRENTLAIHAGTLYAMAEGAAALALDAASGKERWRNAEAGVAWAAMNHPKGSNAGGGSTQANASAVLFYHPIFGILACDPGDGKQLWSKHEQELKKGWNGVGHGQPILRDGLVITGGQAAPWSKKVIDARTGVIDEAASKGMHIVANWGGPSQNPTLLSGSCGPTYRFDTKTAITNSSISEMSYATVGIFAEGLLSMRGSSCTCDMRLRGHLTQVSAGAFPLHQPVADPKRLVTTTAKAPAIAKADPGDWTAYRAGNDRSNASPATTPASTRLTTVWKPAVPVTVPPENNTTDLPLYAWNQPLVVGGAVILSGDDGVLRNLDRSSGAERWRFATSGRLPFAPVWWQGRLLVGSADGWLYALAADDGRELWRFRVAPTERRIIAYGQLQSTWPIMSGVTVHDGVAYVAGCLNNNDGAVVYALDADSGAVRWHNADSGKPVRTNPDGLAPLGTPTIAGDRLLFPQVSYALKDGAAINQRGQTAAYKTYSMFGRYVGRLAEGVYLRGGRNLLGDQLENLPWGTGLNRGVQVLRPTAKDPQAKTQGLLPYVDTFPSWDAQGLAVAWGRMHKPYDADKELKGRTVSYLHYLAGSPETLAASASAAMTLADVAKPLPLEAWHSAGKFWYAYALTANAVVAARLNEDGSREVLAFKRSDGGELWKHPLDGIPAEDGLAIAADGGVYLQLLDGRLLGLVP